MTSQDEHPLESKDSFPRLKLVVEFFLNDHTLADIGFRKLWVQGSRECLSDVTRGLSAQLLSMKRTFATPRYPLP
jgi:hypothetical protein